MTTNDEVTTPAKIEGDTAICAICGEGFNAERAELGYNYCMRQACAKLGFKAKPVEVEVVPTETRF